MLITILTVAQVIVALALIVVVLLQHGKQQGLSGAIAGGAETFFGKNKGRTVDVMLKKFTSVVAILFIALSLSLTFATSRQAKANDTANETEVTETEGGEITSVPIQISEDKSVILNMDNTMTDAEGNILTMNDNSDLVREDGTVYATSEEFQSALAANAVESENVTDVTDSTEAAEAE